MGLDQRVEFKARIQKGNRIQIPVKIRGVHKLEAEETWQVKITVEHRSEKFYGSMTKGKNNIPKRIVREYQYRELVGNTAEVVFVSSIKTRGRENKDWTVEALFLVV